MPKAKEAEAQPEPEDGGEDTREEGKFLKYLPSPFIYYNFFLFVARQTFTYTRNT